MIKITIGLQPHHIERIEQECARFDISSSDLDSPGLQKGWVLYDDYFWIKLGKEFGWTPLKLSLSYHEYLNGLKQEAGENAYWLLAEHLPPVDRYKNELNEIGKIFNVE